MFIFPHISFSFTWNNRYVDNVIFLLNSCFCVQISLFSPCLSHLSVYYFLSVCSYAILSVCLCLSFSLYLSVIFQYSNVNTFPHTDMEIKLTPEIDIRVFTYLFHLKVFDTRTSLLKTQRVFSTFTLNLSIHYVCVCRSICIFFLVFLFLLLSFYLHLGLPFLCLSVTPFG